MTFENPSLHNCWANFNKAMIKASSGKGGSCLSQAYNDWFTVIK